MNLDMEEEAEDGAIGEMEGGGGGRVNDPLKKLLPHTRLVTMQSRVTMWTKSP